ncbi:sensor histidine kinase [Streptomyces narbonensis]|uniref:sensor histidine kinase n=1 Tax=Streptomyces narbonensis TaxID=67333 RepID=UPI00167AC4E8|nr:histidine kinase [Streptomyces narbonensis]GGW02041.1 histidine kinase [Streptomyces narbonensis]
MSRLTGWWSRRGSAAKVELYTRWSFHFFTVIEIGSIALVPLSEPGDGLNGLPVDLPLGLVLALFVCAHAVLTAVVSSRALDWALDRREQPVRLATALVVLTAGGALTVIALRATGVLEEPAVATAVVTGIVVFSMGGLVLCVRRPRRMLYAVPATGLATGGAMAAMGLHPAEGLGSAVGILLGGYGLAAACGFSGWLMKIVWELERSRDLKARLAVAEERLRFGRDLHDVMGRNLSVIALKSELAVQLARRERPEAVDQMIEVQRIARESQREVRDVVRGYREADLRVELEGARGVLGAAGIDCAIASPFGPTGTDLPDEVQSALGWVVRETTTNVLRHGDARRCAISVREEEDGVLLTVENDGVRQPAEGGARGGAGPSSGLGSGLGSGGSSGLGSGGGSGLGSGLGSGGGSGLGSGGGSGLAGLRERLAAVGGTLEAGPGGDGTFRVAARVPVPRTPGVPSGSRAGAGR